ncbi:group III truncated hemoglobin [Pedobacter sp. Leaf176]|uniref:group III truncated hemoglobin n=1 Tax=Pedobacter sp. Leaf176 TaxID=1736286 RepID=UPI0006F9597E|nr:group III truncated hemoglobin [Pedobacter sp. Leaf176]KQR70610.1 sec-independent protein translocase TatC [Pedobacter sp. Leaf176]
MKTDIQNRDDIIILVNTFYYEVQKNDKIGTIFTDVAKVDWSLHLPKMYDFWESILFGKAVYKGNPMLTHFKLKEKATMQEQEFSEWKNTFFTTVDELFEGGNAEIIKQKAQSIADLMHFKLNPPESRINIV